MELSTKCEQKIYNFIIKESKRLTNNVAHPPTRYTVNCIRNQAYARDCFKTLKEAFEEMITRGEDFTLGASWSGGWSTRASAGTSDFGIIIPSVKMIELLNE